MAIHNIYLINPSESFMELPAVARAPPGTPCPQPSDVAMSRAEVPHLSLGLPPSPPSFPWVMEADNGHLHFQNQEKQYFVSQLANGTGLPVCDDGAVRCVTEVTSQHLGNFTERTAKTLRGSWNKAWQMRSYILVVESVRQLKAQAS